ncbi:MAG TPA: DUF2877 domain-containing protein [Candidatus Ozemobacteraceae bacterium]|nr:DUF2877 domain-containing protein [Candidatus Ozemobacteraceae bacterium]
MKESLFGRVLGVDPRLADDTAVGGLSLRLRADDALVFFTSEGRMVSLVTAARGRGPDAIVLERLPRPDLELAADNWSIAGGKLIVPGHGMLNLQEAPSQPSNMLAAVRDFPGHLRSSLGRALRGSPPPLESALADLSRSLKESHVEAAERPVLSIVGRGMGVFPDGDAAMCGFLLTGRACELGGRLRADWHGRLAMEVRRFLHRTTPFAIAWLRFALEGRTDAFQERLFDAMSRDVETAADVAVDEMMRDPSIPGIPFLTGVAAALDLVNADLRQSGIVKYRTS